jgi:hypothetical protein
MKSSKWILGLMVAVLVLALAPSSFAQVQITIFNSPSPGEIQTNRNAQTSDPTSVGAGITVSGAVFAAAPLTTTQLILTFPAIISSSPDSTDNSLGGGQVTAVPTADPMRIDIAGATGLFKTASIATVKFSDGTVTITLPGFGPTTNVTPADSGSFRLLATRLDVNGKTAPLNATATLSSSANNYQLSTTSFPLINTLGPGIGSLTQGTIGSASNLGTTLMFNNQTTGAFADATASFVLAEGFANAWRTNTQVSTKGAAGPLPNGTLIRLTIGGLPTGVTATLSQITTTSTPGITLTYASGGAFDATNNTALIAFTATNPTVIENLAFDLTLGGVPTGTINPGSITVTATHAPIGNALSSGNPTQTAPTGFPTGYIRFAQADVGPLTIGTIVAANTTMLIPYAVRVGTYDTGIAIANTTLDPFGAAGGGATATAGTMVFTMFPRNATGADPSFTLTTSSTVRPGVGLSTSGTLVAGGTWTGLMSDIMTAAGKTGDYFGYIFIQTNFLNAHGAAYIFNGAGFTSATPVLVLAPPASSNRNGTVEALNN